MKNLSVISILFLVLISCSKEEVEQQVQEDALLKIMTNGTWKVTSFMKGSTNATTDFSIYHFQFKSNLTVDALLMSNHSVEKTGTWNANATAKTITSNFTNASATLMLLNGTWLITKSGLTYVEAEQNVNGELRTLRLDKM